MDAASSPLQIEAGGRQAEVTDALLCRLIDIACCGDASDRARFCNYTASRILMANAIGVAKTLVIWNFHCPPKSTVFQHLSCYGKQRCGLTGIRVATCSHLHVACQVRLSAKCLHLLVAKMHLSVKSSPFHFP